MRELTVRAVVIGLLIGTVLTAANTYLGLYAGMTVTGSIPAAIVSMGILRGLLKRGTIRENNIVQTVASAGEAVAAGIIFTVPAMLITGVWMEFSFWKVSLIGLLGGLLGVLFMVPLRRVLIVEDKELIYPEGVACAQVLEAGESGGSPMRTILSALGSGLLFKSLVGLVAVFRNTAEAAWRVAGTVLYGGTDVSVALLGVGVIVGVEIGIAALAGSVIAWLFAIPIFYWQSPLAEQSALDAAWTLWSSQIRYMGVGAMIVGGLASMWNIRSGIAKAVRHLLGGIGKGGQSVERSDQDLPNSLVGAAFAVAAVGTFVLYQSVTGSLAVALTAGTVMLVSSLFFVAVSSYICGLVGSSNNPISGTTICALMFSSVILLILGMTGSAGILGALGVASIVCCAAATAGDTSQDLKTGQLVGATPRLQQTGQLIGILVPVFTIAPVLTLLHKAYGIGTGEPDALLAPQATLFASIAEGLFGDSNIPWTMVWIGALIAIGIVLVDGLLQRSGSRFRAHVMPVAVGIYLPLSLMVPIFLGGLISQRLQERSEGARHKGLLIASGLIAGEAIAGILIAIPKTLFTGIEIPVPLVDSLWLSLAAVALVMFLIDRFASRNSGAT
ncbi:MAG: oligopeptide transporter, OPT family [Bryobacterales bacterium]|nr:oligopeptide transporter, OPT family [Bryobacterales bacterium]MDE0623751.1 oligopeptide transporter, OPT family [Bryobacterales bacterium]